MKIGKVLSVNLSAKRGIKKAVEQLILNSKGIDGDVHARNWNRQISIIDTFHINKFRDLTNARNTEYGEFAENITSEGLFGFIWRINSTLHLFFDQSNQQ